jgi:hypothetical protein
MEYKEVAKIKVTGVFDITNRGKVLLVKILHGEIGHENYFKLIIDEGEVTYEIHSIDIPRTNNIEVELGLLVIPQNNPELSHLEKATGQTIAILVTI